MERDPKRIAREWKREIDAEIRRLAEKEDSGWGRNLVWALLAFAWLLLVMEGFGILPRP
ncbi:MAG TPA: hypothetical protein VJ770_04605 [Stellaceae bacterium]|nr:hypothetical protein [Stellaceae bacterium]